MQQERTRVEVAFKKDATVSYKDDSGETIEYRVFNFMSRKKWVIGLFAFTGCGQMDTFNFNPIPGIQEKFEVLEEITLITGPDNTITIEYPSHAKLRVIDIRDSSMF